MSSQRRPLAGLLHALPLSFLGLACSPKPDDERPDTRRRSGGKRGGKGAVALKPVEATDFTGKIAGKVVWNGPKPNLEAETQALVAQVKGKQDESHCSAGNSVQHSYRFGANGNLGN